MKKKTLLVGDSHIHIINEYYQLLSEVNKVDIYWSIRYKKKTNSFIRKKTKFFTYPTGLVFFFLIFKSFKYNHIFLVTGPEQFNGTKGLIGMIGYLIFVLFFGKKIIMGIRDNSKYFKNSNEKFIEKILNFVRYISLIKIRCLHFETKTLMSNFKKEIHLRKIQCLTIYPFHSVINNFKPHQLNSKILRIGLLGSVSEKKSRRDYKLLVNVLSAININLQKKIEIVLLGGVAKGSKNEVVKNLKKKIKSKIIYKKNYIKESKYLKLTSSCHLLLSINKKNYGNSYKGTGSFFDAISARKLLITNLRSDRQYEFKKFCYYYSNGVQLLKKLQTILKNLDEFKSLNSDNFSKYNNNEAKTELAKLLC